MRYRAILFTTVLVITTVAAQQRLTLDEAIRIGIDQSRSLKISTSKTDAASAKAQEVQSNLLPSVNFDAGYRRLSDVPPFQISSKYLPYTITVAPTVLDNYTVHLGVQQPLFTGLRLLNNTRAARSLAEASEFDQHNDQSDLILNITAAYWTLYQAIQSRQFAEENITRLQSYETDTKNMLDAGLATRNDLLRVEVQLDNARLTQIDAANDVQVATMNLNNLIGQPLETELQPTSQPDSSAAPTDSVSALLPKAFAQRQDLLAMQSRIAASRSSVSAARGGYLPQLFLSGNYYYNRPNSRYQPTIDQFKSTWDVGVQLQFDVWNWGATSAQVEQTNANLVQAELQYDQMKENISLELKRSVLNLRRASEKIGVAKLAVDQADENARSIHDKFREGLATSTELLDANVALLQAKTNYTGALVECEIANARLKKASGDLR